MPNIGPTEIAIIGLIVLTFIALPVAIVLLVVHLLRTTPSRRRVEADHAVEIVRLRFARGEISQADFEAALRALGREPRPSTPDVAMRGSAEQAPDRPTE